MHPLSRSRPRSPGSPISSARRSRGSTAVSAIDRGVPAAAENVVTASGAKRANGMRETGSVMINRVKRGGRTTAGEAVSAVREIAGRVAVTETEIRVAATEITIAVANVETAGRIITVGKAVKIGRVAITERTVREEIPATVTTARADRGRRLRGRANNNRVCHA